jgi:hypothetical protein
MTAYFFLSKAFTTSLALSNVAPASLPTCLPDCASSDFFDASVPSSVLMISALESKSVRRDAASERI